MELVSKESYSKYWRIRILNAKYFHFDCPSILRNDICYRRCRISFLMVNWKRLTFEIVLWDWSKYSWANSTMWYTWWKVFWWWECLCFDNYVWNSIDLQCVSRWNICDTKWVGLSSWSFEHNDKGHLLENGTETCKHWKVYLSDSTSNSFSWSVYSTNES